MSWATKNVITAAIYGDPVCRRFGGTFDDSIDGSVKVVGSGCNAIAVPAAPDHRADWFEGPVRYASKASDKVQAGAGSGDGAVPSLMMAALLPCPPFSRGLIPFRELSR